MRMEWSLNRVWGEGHGREREDDKPCMTTTNTLLWRAQDDVKQASHAERIVTHADRVEGGCICPSRSYRRKLVCTSACALDPISMLEEVPVCTGNLHFHPCNMPGRKQATVVMGQNSFRYLI